MSNPDVVATGAVLLKMENIKEYLNLPYTIKLIPEADGTYYAYVEELPGCATVGDTKEEATEKIREAMEGWIESNLERGLEIPKPSIIDQWIIKKLRREVLNLRLNYKQLCEIADSLRVDRAYLVEQIWQGYRERNWPRWIKCLGTHYRALRNYGLYFWLDAVIIRRIKKFVRKFKNKRSD